MLLEGGECVEYTLAAFSSSRFSMYTCYTFWSMKRYRIYEQINSQHPLVKEYGRFTAQLLLNRGVETREDAERFLNPQWGDIHNPFLMRDMEKVVERIRKAVDLDEKILIYSDYDADGVPGAVILSEFFKKLGHTNYEIYIPHRHNEGYGMHPEIIERFLGEGVTLVVSIDVGIRAFEAVKLCRKHDVDCIITDHHLPEREGERDILPDAFAVLDPKRDDEEYPFRELCGTGVIFKFIQAFLQRYREEFSINDGWEKWLLDMVGIATLSDMVPLRDENRAFAQFGLRVMREVLTKRGKREGLRLLALDAGIHPHFFTEEDITFGITPRINAASRMSHAKEALRVFQDYPNDELQIYVEWLNSLNSDRKEQVRTFEKEALGMLDGESIDGILFLGKEYWSPGILGLIASKLVNTFALPTFIWGGEENRIKGSVRSSTIPLTYFLEEGSFPSSCEFGGHREAGGFSCKKEALPAFEREIKRLAREWNDSHQDEELTIPLDMELVVDEIQQELYEALRKLAPFGVGNEKPLFLIKGVRIDYAGEFGKEKNHFELAFRNSLGKRIRGIAFFHTRESFSEIYKGGEYDLVAQLEYSVFRGRHELRLRIVDLFPSRERDERVVK